MTSPLVLTREPAGPSQTGAAQQAARPLKLLPVLVFIAVHLVLGVLGQLTSHAATAHAAVVAGVLLLQAGWGRRLDRLVAITGYAALCDLYWRMSESRAPWEFSKYLLLIGSVAILVRYSRRWQRPVAPLALLACLASGVVALLMAEGIGPSREIISSDEMGLISLAVGALAFRQIVATATEGWNLCWVMLGPVAAALGVVTWSVLTTADLEFGSESNFAVTGGYGPNQVSSVLGLGILLCVLLAFQRRGKHFLVVSAALGLWMTWATFLTFSRGGIYSLVLAGGALLLVGVGTRGARTRSLVTAAVAVVGLVIMFTSANDFSGNWLDARYGDDSSSASGRASLAEMDLQVWGDHPLLGVGTGQSVHFHRGGNVEGAATHTEFTRMLAEHGLFGLVAIGLLGVMVVSGLRASLSRWNRLLVAGAGVWALTTMLHAATRLAAVSLLFALTQLRVEPDPSDPRRS